MKRKIIILIVILLYLAGCAHWLEIHQLPPGSEDFLPSEVGVVIPAILKSVEVRVNGEEVEPEQDFIRLVLKKIRRTYVFSEVYLAGESAKTKLREKAVKLKLFVDTEVDTHEISNLVKITATCASLFLLAPVLPLKDDFDATIILKAVRYDGKERYYKSRLRGTIHYPIFGVSQSRKDARAEVMTKTLNSLMNQMMENIDFYAIKD
jgi:hypothetical protein